MSVENGSVEHDHSAPGVLHLHVYSEKAVLGFSSFDIASGEMVEVHHHSLTGDPGVLSRVFNGLATRIGGRFLSNGQFILVNPSGILFDGTAEIQAMGGFIASTLDITNEDFLAGRLHFEQMEGRDPARVVNHGRILTGPGEILALLGGAVQNDGLLVADLGSVALASGKQVTLSFDREGWLAISVDQPLDRVAVGPDGRPVKEAVYQSGDITAGQVLIRASALEGLFDRLITLPAGVIEATGVVNRGGRVELIGEGGALYQGGTVRANAAEDGQAGEIRVVAEDVTLAEGSRLEARASGERGRGGSVQVTSPRPKESGRVDFQSGSVIDVSGGSVSGDAGSIELSASTVEFGGRVVGTAQEGSRGGRILVDPLNLIFNTSAQASPPNNGSGTPDIAAGDPPAAGTTTLQINDITGFAEAFFQAVQDITLNNNLTMANNNDLRLEAGRNINLNANARVQGNNGDMTLTADADFSGSGGAASDGVGTIVQAAGTNIRSGNGDMTLKTGGDFTVREIQSGGSGTIRITSTHGKILDDGDASTRISGGGELLLESLSGIGAPGAALGTSVDTLAARVSGTGDIRVTEQNRLTLGTVLGVGGVETADGSVEITSGDRLTVENGSVVANGAGSDVTLTALDENLRVGRIQAADDIFLSALDGKIEEFSPDAGADIIGDELTLAADKGVGTSGALETDINTLILNVASGGVTLADQGSFTLNTPVALGAGVSLDLSAANDLRTADNSAVAVTGAGTVKLEAGTSGAGELVVKKDLTSDAGDITLKSATRMDLWRVASDSGKITATSGTDLIVRDAVTTGGGAGITATAAGSLRVRSAQTPGGTVKLTSTTGAIERFGPAGSTNISSGTAELTAASGIGTGANGPLETAVDTLTAGVTGTGDVRVTEADALLLAATTADGSIAVTAGGPITVSNASVTANGAGRDVTLTTTAGDLILGNVVADDLVTLTAAGSILENGDDPGADVAGTDGLLTAGGTIGLSGNPLEIFFSNSFTAVNAPGGLFVNDLNAPPPPALPDGGLGAAAPLSTGPLLSPPAQSNLLSQILSFLSEEENRRLRSQIG